MGHGSPRQAAQFVLNDLNSYAGGLRASAALIGARHDASQYDRPALIEGLKLNLKAFPLAFGSWFIESPKAFDGRQDELRDNEDLGANASGILAPYWTRSADGTMDFSTFKENYLADWWTQSANSGKGSVSAPYVESSTGRNVLITSIIEPVRAKGTLMGLIGLDIDLGNLSARLTELRPLGEGRVMFLSGDGKWIAQADPALRTKPYGEGEGNTALAAALATGETQVFRVKNGEGNTLQRTFFPFHIETLSATWVVVADVPESAITGPANRQAAMMFGGVVVAFLLTVLLVTLASHAMIARPLRRSVEVAEAISKGDLTQTIEARGRDEIGDLLRAMARMNERLRQIVGDVSASAAQVATGAAQSAATAEQLSSGSTEQASASEEASAAVEEMTANVRENADNANQTEKMAAHVFGTIKDWMGRSHFKTRRLPNVGTEMSLHVLAYNMKRAIALLGTTRLMAAMRG